MASIKTLAIITALNTLCLTAIPGQATTLLRGYLSQDQEEEAQQDSANIPCPTAVNSFPVAFEGIWQCQTEVVDSNIDSVPAGQKVISEIQFAATADGNIAARWNQAGWTETQSSLVRYSPNQIVADRTSYYYGQGLKGAWATRSHDQFTQLNKTAIISQSYIDQYIDGQYLGRYRTRSVLHRVCDSRNIANSP